MLPASEVESLYDWPRPPHIERPFKAQIETVRDLLTHKKWFVLNEIGMGKTFTALWAQDILRRQGLIKRVLIVVSKSPMGDAWLTSIPWVLPNFTDNIVIMADVSAKKRRELYHSDWQIGLINPEGLHIIQDEKPDWGQLDLIIVDESTMFKNWTSRRTKALRKISTNVPGMWLMTAIPDPEGPPDLWAQVKLIYPDRVPRYFGMWRDLTMKQVSEFKWVSRPEAVDVMATTLKGISSRHVRADSMDLPPLQEMDMTVDPTAEFQKFAKTLQQEAAVLMAGGAEAIARNGASLVSKILQAAGGAVKTTLDGEETISYIDCTPRLELLDEVLRATDRPILVPSFFTAGLDVVEQWLIKKGIPYARVDGRVKTVDRQAAFRAVQEERIKVLLNQPTTMQHGVTLTAANGVFWWTYPQQREAYSQLIGRMTRFGQTSKMMVFRPRCCTTERATIDMLDSKITNSTLLAQVVESLTTLR